MIYIRTEYDWMCDNVNIVGAYQVGCRDAKEQYEKFMIGKASELNLVINPNYLNAMDYENNNTHLTKQDYHSKSKQWKKTLRMWNIGKFICEVLKGVKIDYKVI